MFHHNWVKTKGRVIDSRIRKMLNTGGDHSLQGSYLEMHSYLIEFRTPDGELTRLEVEQHVDTVAVSVGSQVPLLVSPDGKKAVFDHKDPSINVIAVNRANEQADRERFQRELGT
ncbi:MAG TPA: hypothetical protein VFI65_03980 [Streptosporangiaceae bacterium]|nr:hypothetical protein [Streptosporangiaceae bacterium]